MENFNIKYYNDDKNLILPTVIGVEYPKNEKVFKDIYAYRKVGEIKKIITEDFNKALNSIVLSKDNNCRLSFRINHLLRTYNRDISESFYSPTHFLFLTDNYLCFNNVNDINNIDNKLVYDYKRTYGDRKNILEEIIIVNRNYMSYYFITVLGETGNKNPEYVIESFNITDYKIISSIVRTANEDFIMPLDDEKDIENVIEKVKSYR